MNASVTNPKRERRTALLKVRLTPKELAEARRRAQGRNLSGIVRAALLGLAEPKIKPGPKPRLPMSEFEAKKTALLAWFGNNLNQLTKSVHTGRLNDTALLVALLRLERQMKDHSDAT